MASDDSWFDVQEIGPGIWYIGEPGHFEDVHSFLIEGERDVAVIDTGMGVGDFASVVRQLSDREPLVVQTHAHWDHIGASWQYERVLVHASEQADLERGFPNEDMREWFTPDRLTDRPLPASFDVNTAEIPGATATGTLEDGQVIDLGNRQIEIIHTPGHSPGGVTILDRATRTLFPGDAVYYGPIYIYSEETDMEDYALATERLAALASEVEVVYPSHNRVPMRPQDLLEIQRAYGDVMQGRQPENRTAEYAVHDFGNFSFYVDPEFGR